MMSDWGKLYLTYRLYIFPTIVGISSLILIIFVVYPQTASLISNQTVASEVFNKSQFLDTKVSALESYDEVDLANKVNIALGFYPTEKDIIPVFAILQSVVSQKGFIVNSMSLGGSVAQSSKSQSFGIKLEAIGPKQLLTSLLMGIESSKRLMRVNSVDVISEGNSGGVGVAIEVEVLYSASPKDLGSIDSPIPELSGKDQEVLSKLAVLNKVNISQQSASASSGLKGKANPFE